MNPALRNFLLKKKKTNFYEFMKEALYNSSFGYYGSGKAVIGSKGDFYTSSSLKMFGYALAEYFCKITEQEGISTQFVELGGSDGFFAHSFLSYLEKFHRPIFKNTNYIIIEKNPGAGEFIKKSKFAKKVEILKDLTDLNPIEGVIFGNEFWDSFPARVFKKINGKIHEKFIIKDGDNLRMNYEEINLNKENNELIKMFQELPEDHTFEYQPDFEKFIGEMSQKHSSGIVIFIDYFEKSKTLLLSKRNGSIRCFYNHKLISDPLKFAGDCDITVTVNVDHLIHSLEKVNYLQIQCEPQWKFLFMCGIEKVFKNIEKMIDEKDRIFVKMSLNTLLSSAHLGEVFSAVIGEKNIN